MRKLPIVALCAAVFAALPAFAETVPPVGYKVEQVGEPVYEARAGHLYGKVRYRLTNPHGVKVSEGDRIVIYEDNLEVARLPVPTEKVKIKVEVKKEDLTTVLALDVSASMSFNNKIREAKKAAGVFLDKLGHRMDTGLILFNDRVPIDDPTRFLMPSGNHANDQAQTDRVRVLINQAQPLGGSAYRDATVKAIDMLKDVPGRRAVVLMTDGVDVNSRVKLDEVIKRGRTAEVPVYTVGIGAPGLNTVLVLDHSGSMAAPANNSDKKSKIEALHEAGKKFVDEMQPGSKVTLLPFSTDVSVPEPFTDNKQYLIDRIRSLRPEGGTSLYDATMTGIETLVAANPPGNRVVVVLTDGKDESPGSRFSDEAVVERARQVGIKLYMLGLGRKKEINETVMTRMAQQTGGRYFYVDRAETLIETFAQLSADLNDMGALKRLAEETKGKYYRANDVSELQDRFQEVAEVVLKEEVRLKDTLELYESEFRSRRDVSDGTHRKIRVEVEGAEGEKRSNVTETHGQVHGLVVPEQSPVLYLVLLGCVAGCLVLPQGLRILKGSAK
jgi:VWFA-related protein